MPDELEKSAYLKSAGKLHKDNVPSATFEDQEVIDDVLQRRVENELKSEKIQELALFGFALLALITTFILLMIFTTPIIPALAGIPLGLAITGGLSAGLIALGAGYKTGFFKWTKETFLNKTFYPHEARREKIEELIKEASHKKDTGIKEMNLRNELVGARSTVSRGRAKSIEDTKSDTYAQEELAIFNLLNKRGALATSSIKDVVFNLKVTLDSSLENRDVNEQNIKILLQKFISKDGHTIKNQKYAITDPDTVNAICDFINKDKEQAIEEARKSVISELKGDKDTPSYTDWAKSNTDDPAKLINTLRKFQHISGKNTFSYEPLGDEAINDIELKLDVINQLLKKPSVANVGKATADAIFKKLNPETSP